MSQVFIWQEGVLEASIGNMYVHFLSVHMYSKSSNNLLSVFVSLGLHRADLSVSGDEAVKGGQYAHSQTETL